MRTQKCAAALIGLAAVLVLCAVTPALANLTGAVWTTTGDGMKVNANLYDQKCPPTEEPCVTPPLVPFLSGGPSFASPTRWVPNGDYYFQVTDPSGKVLLSTDSIACRRFEVATVDGRKVVIYPDTVDNGNPDEPEEVNPAPHTTCLDVNYLPELEMKTIALCPFDDTPNNGGVYKLWITRVKDYVDPDDPRSRFGFVPSDCKTDNFKVKKLASIWGDKVDDQGDPVEGLHVILYKERKVHGDTIWDKVGETCTLGDGTFSFSNLSDGSYKVVEDLDLSLCDACGCTDYSEMTPLGPTEIPFTLNKAAMGGRGKNGAPGEPIYIGQFENQGQPFVAALQGVKFLDRDGDGCWDDSTEPTLDGWTICLEQKNGNGDWVQAVDLDGKLVDCQTINDVDLAFNFGNLPVPMTYRISETPQDGWLQTGPNTSSTEIEDPCGDILVTPPGADVTAIAVDGTWIVNFGETADLLTNVGNLNFGNKLASICVEKKEACSGRSLSGFTFTLWDCACEEPAKDAFGVDLPSIVTGGDDDCWDNLLAGSYCVKETPALGWDCVGPAEQCITVEAGGTATATFTNWAPCMGLTPGYWKNWRNHYTSEQFCLLLDGTIADIGACAANIAEADDIFEHWDASPGDELTIMKAFLLADQLTLNLTQHPGLPNPSDGSLVGDSTLSCDGTPIVLSEAIAEALACLADSCSRDDLLTVKNWLACFANARYSTCPCVPGIAPTTVRDRLSP